MPTENTIRVSLRMQPDVHRAILLAAAECGVEPATYMQDVLEEAVLSYLPEERRVERLNEKQMYNLAQAEARRVFDDGGFTEHFTLTVIRNLMANPQSRKLYEELIGDKFDADGVKRKTPLNMYLGWYIKNAVEVRPLLDDTGRPKRAFVKNEAIKSYTLLAVA